ncbi:MAG: glycosyltransferase family 4 protein [Parvibaculaceae bacterium]|nr:glycosyltransferase family 4 protein [Parvibaculaceae bacterium]
MATVLEQGPFAGMKPPAILQVIPTLDTGGAERTTLDMAAAILRAGGRALVASHGGRLVPELVAMGASHIMLPVHTKNPVEMIANIWRLRALIAREGVDLVHARSRAPAWSALAAARLAHVPFVTTYHSKVHEGPASKVFYNSVMTRGNAVIANSAFTAEAIRRVHHTPDAKLFTVPRGVDTAIFDPQAVDPARIEALRRAWGVEPGQFIFLLPARLTRWKGQTLAIEAAARLGGRTGQSFALVLAGDAQGRDAYVTELRAQIARLGLLDRAKLAGHVIDMPAAYLLADAALAPSLEAEPFGRVPVDAQAMGCPVIVSDAGGQRETVIDPAESCEAATGFRVQPGNIEALAQAMERVLGLDSQARAAMGKRGRARVCADFSLDAMCARTLEIYACLLKKR